MSPCTHSLSRDILAATGLDPYLLSCAGNDNTASNKTARARRPIVTDQRCATRELPPFHCCPPPFSSEPIPFAFPDPASPLRTRRPAHAPAGDHMAKYARAVALMKALPASDPRSFHQQANIHCAYCTGAHRQAGQPDDDDHGVEVHFAWLFFPFHRAYLYFFERIAAKLLGDPTFALPFWIWDVPEGMSIPQAFANKSSPLHDANREPSHAPPRLVDLDFAWGEEKNLTDEDQVTLNLRLMHRQMLKTAGAGAPPPSLFLGRPYRAGDPPMPGAGAMEWAPQNTMHVWTGDQSLYSVEDMGVYYSAGRDPIFYTHHANIDRLWEVWRRRVAAGGGRPDLDDPDWLDSSFLLCDEEARLVRVAVRDMLDVDRLRYAYDDGGGGRPPWLDARSPVTAGVNPKRGRTVEAVRFPASLIDKAVAAEVRRPPGAARRRWWRSLLSEEKPAQEEVLVVEGIETEAAEFVRFDVYVNAREFHKVPPGGREMAGSFTTLKRPGGKVIRTSTRVALSELLEDLGAGGDDGVIVTLVPVRGNVTIGGLSIVYM